MHPPAVVKVGGSLLRGPQDYAAVADALRPLAAAGPLWTVVSAAKGVTDLLADPAVDADALLALHARLAGGPLPLGLQAALHAAHADLAARLAWGEQASAHILQTRLQEAGRPMPAVELAPSRPPPGMPHAVVPGFFLRDGHGRLRILPRGGSDISAVLVARWTGGRHVRLWKSGGGLQLEPGVVAERADADAVVAWLGGRVRPLHPDAVRLAARLGVALTVEDPWGRDGATRIEPLVATAVPMPSWALPDVMADALGAVLEGAAP